VTLATGGTDDRDRYGRLLRYVEIADGTVDVGAHLLVDGVAVARYDSRDGYGHHDREATYHWLDDQWSPHAADNCDDEQPAPTTTDNPYDDGGPRNEDGSCPPGGCTPDNPNPDLNNNPYDDGGARNDDGSCPPGGCR
jgi:hypothetical protein